MKDDNSIVELEYARKLDSEDGLALFREEFVIDDPDLIYLDGNSLGRLPERTRIAQEKLVGNDWGARLIRLWNDGWVSATQRIGSKIAQIVGAEGDEVIVADSTSVNLFKLAVSALKSCPGRRKIVTDDLNFPSDIYIMQGVQAILGNRHELVVVPSPDGISMPLEHLQEEIDQDTALVILSHTTFKSGYTYDMHAATQMAHESGALMLWDMSHSAGAVPIELNLSNADLGVGCTYKYLNGGPGSPAFLYVRKDLLGAMDNPISGWFGQWRQFDFALDYLPKTDIRKFLTGSPPILSLAGIEAGVELILEAGVERLREKSVRQTEYLIELWKEILQPIGFQLNSPRDPKNRGSHVSLGHKHGLEIDLALINEMNVLPDFRAPDNIRIGIAPLYTRYEDIYTAVSRMRSVVTNKIYEQYTDSQPGVT
jgi:kynureninase